MENQSAAFESLSVPKALAKFIIPSVVSQLTMLILNLTDAFFVGRTADTYQIAAMTVTFPIVMTIGCIATIFGAGGNANVAAALGNKETQRAKQFSVFSLYTAVGLVAILAVLLVVIEKDLLVLLGADGNSAGYCHGYLRWVFYTGGVPLAFSQVMSQLFVSEGETNIASAGIAGAGLLNAVLDPVLIFTCHMGVEGAGLATCIANYCSLLFFIIMYVGKRKTSVLSLDIRLYSLGNGICTRTLAIGIPAGIGMLLLNGCDFIRNALLKVYGGQIDLAAWGVVQKIGNSFTQICVGISQGTRPLVAYNYSAKAIRRTKALISGSCLIMGGYTVICVLLVVAIPKLFVGLFLPIEEAMPVAVSFLQKWIVGIIGIGYIELFNSIFQAMGCWKTSLVSVVTDKLSIILVLLLFVRLWGITGIITAQPVVETAVAVILAVLYIVIMKKPAEVKDE